MGVSRDRENMDVQSLKRTLEITSVSSEDFTQLILQLIDIYVGRIIDEKISPREGIAELLGEIETYVSLGSVSKGSLGDCYKIENIVGAFYEFDDIDSSAEWIIEDIDKGVLRGYFEGEPIEKVKGKLSQEILAACKEWVARNKK